MTDYRALALEEAGEREARFKNARMLSGTQHIARDIRNMSEDDIANRVVDNRICPKCSVRAVHHVGELDCGKWQAL
jgi:ribosomal protein S27AE